jgi:hypothetical protein
MFSPTASCHGFDPPHVKALGAVAELWVPVVGVMGAGPCCLARVGCGNRPSRSFVMASLSGV